MKQALLSLRDVSRAYDIGTPWHALQNVDLDVHRGEFVAIVGPSGSGKSTLLNILGLLDAGWLGSYRLAGVDVKGLSSPELDRRRAETFGYVFQSSFANGYETAARNVALGLAIQGVPLAEQRARVADALNRVGLRNKARTLARLLSGGERQRLAIARAVVTRPAVILADEPTGNLDSVASADVMSLLQKLHAQGTTVLVVTHDMEVARFAERMISVRDGIVVGGISDADQAAISGHTSQDRGVSPSPRHLGGAIRFRRIIERATRAINNLTTRPLRSGAIAAAFGIAIAGMVAASGVGASAAQQISERLTSSARDEVRVAVPAHLPQVDRERWIASISSLDDVQAVGQIVPIDTSIASTMRFSWQSEADGREFTGSTLAVDEEALRLMGVTVRPAAESQEWAGQIALVGANALDTLGIGADPDGAELWIAERPYAVAGVVTNAARAPQLMNSVIVPSQQFGTSGAELLVRTRPGYPAAVAEAIPLLLSPAAPAEIAVSTVADLRNLRVGVAADLSGLLGSIAAALLILAILSAASAMFLAVQARTQELGLSRALGLSRGGVASVFVWEGAMIGFGGAIIGVSLGLAITVGVAWTYQWTAVVPWFALAVAPAAGLLCGVLSSLLPAIRAARIDPAEAIR